MLSKIMKCDNECSFVGRHLASLECSYAVLPCHGSRSLVNRLFQFRPPPNRQPRVGRPGKTKESAQVDHASALAITDLPQGYKFNIPEEKPIGAFASSLKNMARSEDTMDIDGQSAKPHIVAPLT